MKPIPIAFILATLAVAGCETSPPSGMVGQLAPNVSGVDLDGVAFQLSDYRGKVVMLDFWGLW